MHNIRAAVKVALFFSSEKTVYSLFSVISTGNVVLCHLDGVKFLFE